MSNIFQNMISKFNALPTWGKAAAAVAVGGGAYLLFKGKGEEQTGDAAIYYPYPESPGQDDFTQIGGAVDNIPSGGLGGGGGSSSGGGGGLTYDDLYEMQENMQNNMNAWGSGIIESMGSMYNREVLPTDTVALGESPRSINQNVTPDYLLYQAQAAYGAARTTAERNAAAAAGQQARAMGASDSGAQGIWKSNSFGSSSGSSSSSSSGSSYNANSALQQAQAAYGAAKTASERNAAAAAGQAARAAGATDAGAQSVWKSKK